MLLALPAAVAWGQRAGSKILVSCGCDVADHAQAMWSLEQAFTELDGAPDGDRRTAVRLGM